MTIESVQSPEEIEIRALYEQLLDRAIQESKEFQK